MDTVVVASIPGDDLALLPRVRLVGDDELGTLKPGDANVDVQDVVGRPAVRLDVGTLLHLDHHHLLVLVGRPRESGLGRKPLLQQGARLGEDGLALVRELPLVVEHDVVPLSFRVQEAVCIPVAVGIGVQGLSGLLADSLEVVLELLADREVAPRLPGPHLLAAQAAHPDLRGVHEVVPRHGLAGSVLSHLSVPRQVAHAAVQFFGLLDHPRVLVLERGHFGEEGHAAALELSLLVEVVQALRMLHQLLGELDAGHDELVIAAVGVEDVVHGVQVQEQVRHVLQLPVIRRSGENILDAIKGQGLRLRDVARVDVGPQLLHAGVPQLTVEAMQLFVRMREEGDVLAGFCLLYGSLRGPRLPSAPEQAPAHGERHGHIHGRGPTFRHRRGLED
mmetsp:Transcript_61048/g.175123  ORF Transcript_61048/g.175123 Transcript_61048/m.175123 type:complete len:391 (-) Transcript_61048:78-1250(-)